MKFRIVMLPAAKEDLRLAARYYEHIKKASANDSSNKSAAKPGLSGRTPMHTAADMKSVRTALVDVFPFMIHFRIEESETRILIETVLHTRMNPESWQQ